MVFRTMYPIVIARWSFGLLEQPEYHSENLIVLLCQSVERVLALLESTPMGSGICTTMLSMSGRLLRACTSSSTFEVSATAAGALTGAR